MLRTILDRIFHRVIKRGSLIVEWPDGTRGSYGERSGMAAAFAFTDNRALARFMADPDLATGELYMDGRLRPIDCDIYDVLQVLMANVAGGPPPMVMRLNYSFHYALRRFMQNNTMLRSQRNVAHHYDLNGQLYDLFLDHDRHYSCAYFARGDETLEEAQAAKMRHIAAKLRLDTPGLRVLDIGSGWGGMALHLARHHRARLTGITLSVEQLQVSRDRSAAAGLGDRVTFELADYRTMTGQFDRIVSIGMFEHVGVPHYDAYFQTIHRLLTPDGMALVHAIGGSLPPSGVHPWINKYIFPGGYSPALSEVFPAIEKSGLVTTDVEILRMHYAYTLRHWRQRFARNRARIATMYDERFCRMFEFYLSGCELAFRYRLLLNFQVQLVPPEAPVMLTRDYMVDAERQEPLPLQLEAAD